MSAETPEQLVLVGEHYTRRSPGKRRLVMRVGRTWLEDRGYEVLWMLRCDSVDSATKYVYAQSVFLERWVFIGDGDKKPRPIAETPDPTDLLRCRGTPLL